MRCSAISSPISPSIGTNIPQNSNVNDHNSDFATDAHYQPLIHRTSMGNLKLGFGKSLDSDNGTSRNDAPHVVTGTKGLTPLNQPIF